MGIGSRARDTRRKAQGVAGCGGMGDAARCKQVLSCLVLTDGLV